jgi:hypothetical protein
MKNREWSPRSPVKDRKSRDTGPSTFDFSAFDRNSAFPPAATTALPLKRFRPALEIGVASEPRGRHHYPLALLTGPHRGRITAVHGPFPLSGHWWDPAERWQRVEWDLQLSNKTLLRLAFDPSKAPSRQWLLEGVYE